MKQHGCLILILLLILSSMSCTSIPKDTTKEIEIIPREDVSQEVLTEVREKITITPDKINKVKIQCDEDGYAFIEAADLILYLTELRSGYYLRCK